MSQTLLFSRDRAGALHVLSQINELQKPGVNETVIFVDLNRSACINFFSTKAYEIHGGPVILESFVYGFGHHSIS